MSRLICFCNGVKEDEITSVIDTVDTASLEIIQDKTGAATSCGRCINSIEALLERKAKEVVNN